MREYFFIQKFFNMSILKNFWIKNLWQSEQKELQMCLFNEGIIYNIFTLNLFAAYISGN